MPTQNVNSKDKELIAQQVETASTMCPVHLVAKSPKEVEGPLVTTTKTTVFRDAEDRTIRRTIDGERASLQLKMVKSGQLVHIHCMNCKNSSEWGKASGAHVEKFYDLSKANGIWTIRCKNCARRWSSAGKMDE